MGTEPAPAGGPPPGRRPVFSRLAPAPHPYDPALDACAAKGELHAAVEENFRYDHRVSIEREQSFDDFGGQPRTLPTLQRACKDYFELRIRSRPDPDYMVEKSNGNNIVVGGVANHRHVRGEVRLGRILDLNGLLFPLKVAAAGGLQRPGRACHRSPR